MVVTGTIAPSRDIPDLTAEETIRIILSNMNLVVPVICAIVVIIIAIVVICILRSKGNHHKGTFFKHFFTNCRRLFFFFFVLFSLFLSVSLSLCLSLSLCFLYVYIMLISCFVFRQIKTKRNKNHLSCQKRSLCLEIRFDNGIICFATHRNHWGVFYARAGTLAPPFNSIHRFDSNGHPIYLPPWMSDWLNLNFMVPMIAMIVIVVGILVICIAITRRRGDMRNGPKDVYCRLNCVTPPPPPKIHTWNKKSNWCAVNALTIPLDFTCFCMHNLIDMLNHWLITRFERLITVQSRSWVPLGIGLNPFCAIWVKWLEIKRPNFCHFFDIHKKEKLFELILRRASLNYSQMTRHGSDRLQNSDTSHLAQSFVDKIFI